MIFSICSGEIDRKLHGISGRMIAGSTPTQWDLTLTKGFERAAQMNMKQICITLMGVTFLYAGVLSLADDLYVGIGMMMVGIIVIVIPLGKAFVRFRNLSSGSTSYAAKTRKVKRKGHLRVVNGEKEDRPTYH